jgi:hypothetical protein
VRKMNNSKPTPIPGTDWTRLLADPDLVRNLGKLLQAYRDASPDRREEALLAAMREVKASASSSPAPAGVESGAKPELQPVPMLPAQTPPFEPDIFGSSTGSDRRQHLRIKCFVAVEIRVNDSDTPIWGNLSNTSRGGCLVETATSVPSGAKVEVGLWVASGKIWVKGLALNGVVTHSGPTAGARIRFTQMNPGERESLRQFLKYVQETTRISHSENNYLQMLK